MSDYLPDSDNALRVFMTNFFENIPADPTTIGITQVMVDDCRALNDTFNAKLDLVGNENTRTTPNVQAKNDAKEALLNGTNGLRQLVNLIQPYPGTTNEIRAQLRITIKDTTPTPAPIPAEAPIFEIESAIGQEIKFSLREPNSDSRGKPPYVASAYVYAFVGETPPEKMTGWQLMGAYGRTKDRVIFSTEFAPPGSQVWLCAQWVNTRNQPGPMCPPQKVFIAGGVAGSPSAMAA